MKGKFEIPHLVGEGSTNHRHVGNTRLTKQRYNSDARTFNLCSCSISNRSI